MTQHMLALSEAAKPDALVYAPTHEQLDHMMFQEFGLRICINNVV